MSLTHKIACAVSILIALILGILIDHVAKYYFYFRFSNEIKVIDILNLLVALGIGVMLPFVIKKLIDDNRDIKSFLVAELQELIVLFSDIRKIIKSAYELGKFTQTDRTAINYSFHLVELKVQSIREQADISFKKETPAISKALQDLLFTYKDYLTGGELMPAKFTKIDDRFYKEHNLEYSKVETGIKKLIHKIYKF